MRSWWCRSSGRAGVGLRRAAPRREPRRRLRLPGKCGRRSRGTSRQLSQFPGSRDDSSRRGGPLDVDFSASRSRVAGRSRIASCPPPPAIFWRTIGDHETRVAMRRSLLLDESPSPVGVPVFRRSKASGPQPAERLCFPDESFEKGFVGVMSSGRFASCSCGNRWSMSSKNIR